MTQFMQFMGQIQALKTRDALLGRSMGERRRSDKQKVCQFNWGTYIQRTGVRARRGSPRTLFEPNTNEKLNQYKLMVGICGFGRKAGGALNYNSQGTARINYTPVLRGIACMRSYFSNQRTNTQTKMSRGVIIIANISENQKGKMSPPLSK